jgi:hypothetical protein
MSSQSSVEPCPEPLPFSKNLDFAADVESSLTPSVLESVVVANQFVPVDSILSNQLGPITNPVTNAAFPAITQTMESKASPVLSSYMGADINNSYTLLNNSSATPMGNNSFSTTPVAPLSPSESFNGGHVVEHLKVSPNMQNAPKPMSNATNMSNASNMSNATNMSHAPSDMCTHHMFYKLNEDQKRACCQNSKLKDSMHCKALLSPSNSPSHQNQNKQHFNNVNKSLPEYIKSNTRNTRNTKEHFGNKRKEHFSLTTGSSTFDIVILVAVVGVIAYYVITPSNPSQFNIDEFASKVPVVSSLVDPNVSDTHKLLIVTAIVIAVIVISNMMK